MEYDNIIHNHGVLLMRKQEHTKYRGRREERITSFFLCEHTESPTCTKNRVVAEEFQRQLYACSHLRTYAPIKSAPQGLPTWIYWRLTQPSCPTVSHWLPLRTCTVSYGPHDKESCSQREGISCTTLAHFHARVHKRKEGEEHVTLHTLFGIFVCKSNGWWQQNKRSWYECNGYKKPITGL